MIAVVKEQKEMHKVRKENLFTSTKASVLRLGDNVGFTPLAAITSSGVLQKHGYRV
jgi:hypothetical protein